MNLLGSAGVLVGTLTSPVSRSISESSSIGVGSKVAVVSAEGVLLVSKGVKSFASFDKCWTVRGMEPSEERLTVSPGLGLAMLLRCE